MKRHIKFCCWRRPCSTDECDGPWLLDMSRNRKWNRSHFEVTRFWSNILWVWPSSAYVPSGLSIHRVVLVTFHPRRTIAINQLPRRVFIRHNGSLPEKDNTHQCSYVDCNIGTSLHPCLNCQRHNWEEIEIFAIHSWLLPSSSAIAERPRCRVG